VSSSSAFKWSIALILLVAVAWKIAIPSDDDNDLRDHLVEFFERHHFDVVVKDDMNIMPIIEANAGSCQLRIARFTPDGSNRVLIQRLAVGTDRLFIVFRGRVFTRLPIMWTVINYYWSRFLRELGLIRHITPVIAVASNSSCNAEGLPWDELRSAS
jgi:hypothetical protein